MMPVITKNESEPKSKVQVLRNAEYYDMQSVFDNLYSQSKSNNVFDNLMDLILNRENILLAYRNIKNNKGSYTQGTDKLTIENIGKYSPDKMVERVRNILKNYCPRAVRRVEIPKAHDPSKTRPLGIPCIWDRIIQQCVLQILEPICEAKFSDNSYGFRPNRSCEHAVAKAYKHMQKTNLNYVIEVDIKSFFDEVNHSKLIKQIWALGIRDKKLIYVILQMLKAPILMPSGGQVIPTKGTPQGGILSPLLANIVLNELDKWIESQWEEHPVAIKYGKPRNGGLHKSDGYEAMKRRNLKEMFIVRYADDFRIFCRTKSEAELTLIAVKQWIETRLKLQVSPEKTRVVNLKRKYSEFLGLKIKVHPKGNKYVVKSHIGDKAKRKIADKAVELVKDIQHSQGAMDERVKIQLFNSYVLGVHNYYQIATNVNLDFANIGYRVKRVAYNRLGKRMTKKYNGGETQNAIIQKYGISEQIRFISGIPIAPIAYVQTKPPMLKRCSVQKYTPEGRAEIHKNLGINTSIMLVLMRLPLYDKSVQYADNRIALYYAQYGKCSVTGYRFELPGEIHCHHKMPKSKGGTDKYSNLTLVTKDIHILIHATANETIEQLIKKLTLKKEQLGKLNKLREKAGNLPILI